MKRKGEQEREWRKARRGQWSEMREREGIKEKERGREKEGGRERERERKREREKERERDVTHTTHRVSNEGTLSETEEDI